MRAVIAVAASLPAAGLPSGIHARSRAVARVRATARP